MFLWTVRTFRPCLNSSLHLLPAGPQQTATPTTVPTADVVSPHLATMYASADVSTLD